MAQFSYRRRIPFKIGEFQRRVQQSSVPMIGLWWIHEYRYDDPSRESFFKCTLCNYESLGENMIHHIEGFEHIDKVLKNGFGLSLAEHKVLQQAKYLEEKQGRLISDIRIIYNQIHSEDTTRQKEHWSKDKSYQLSSRIKSDNNRFTKKNFPDDYKNYRDWHREFRDHSHSNLDANFHHSKDVSPEIQSLLQICNTPQHSRGLLDSKDAIKLPLIETNPFDIGSQDGSEFEYDPWSEFKEILNPSKELDKKKIEELQNSPLSISLLGRLLYMLAHCQVKDEYDQKLALFTAFSMLKTTLQYRIPEWNEAKIKKVSYHLNILMDELLDDQNNSSELVKQYPFYGTTMTSAYRPTTILQFFYRTVRSGQIHHARNHYKSD